MDNAVKLARQAAGLSAAEFGMALGYRHANRHHMRTQIYDMESGRKAMSPMIERLSIMFLRHGVPREFYEKGEENS